MKQFSSVPVLSVHCSPLVLYLTRTGLMTHGAAYLYDVFPINLKSTYVPIYGCDHLVHPSVSSHFILILFLTNHCIPYVTKVTGVLQQLLCFSVRENAVSSLNRCHPRDLKLAAVAGVTSPPPSQHFHFGLNVQKCFVWNTLDSTHHKTPPQPTKAEPYSRYMNV